MASRPRRFLPLLLVTLLVLGGCSDLGDPVASDESGGDPDPSTISFDTELRPIFESYGCTNCHGFVNAAATLVNVPAQEYGGAVRIAPGDPEASVLFQKVSRNFAYGGPMPPSGAAVAAEQLDTIKTWIEEGALDN